MTLDHSHTFVYIYIYGTYYAVIQMLRFFDAKNGLTILVTIPVEFTRFFGRNIKGDIKAGLAETHNIASNGDKWRATND